MSSLNLANLVAAIVVGVYVCVAAFWDLREKRIPNRLTIPMFLAGWGYQIAMSLMFGVEHLWIGASGFLVGFGILFVLWMVGGGGGGDVKLMGALGVWLGGHLTLMVLYGSVLVILFVRLSQWVLRFAQKERQRPNDDAVTLASGTVVSERRSQAGANRRAMAFAAPVAIATWIVLLAESPAFLPSAHAVEQPPGESGMGSLQTGRIPIRPF